ncbi:MAG: hypothetical protein WBB07_00280 [Mycobacterium sp.]
MFDDVRPESAPGDRSNISERKRARRVAALAHHPDRGGDHDGFIAALRAAERGLPTPEVAVPHRRRRLRRLRRAVRVLMRRRRRYIELSQRI